MTREEHLDAARPDLSPPGGWLDPESHVRLLALVGGIGAVGWVIGYRTGDDLLTFMATFLVVYSAFMVVSIRDIPFLSDRVEAFIQEWVREEGKFSFYGLIAATYFVKWEAKLLLQELQEVIADPSALFDSFFARVIGFSMDTIMNALSTLIWPYHAITGYGAVLAVVVAGLCWGCVAVGARAFFTPRWMLEEEEEGEGEGEAGDPEGAAADGAEEPESEASPESAGSAESTEEPKWAEPGDRDRPPEPPTGPRP